MDTSIYVDGFNLYYGQLKGTGYKWLDLEKLFGVVLAPHHRITRIKYFTARVQPTPQEPDVHIRLDSYLQALRACCPCVEVHFGHFLRHRVRMENATPPPATWPVWKNEEKGSDVNLALHFLNDAWLNAYECGVIVSNDSDLTEAMSMVKLHHPHKRLGLITPGAPVRRTSAQLASHTDFQRTIRHAALASCQLAETIALPSGVSVSKPATW
jgi:uncharacterized LabA/DUF88 family protein